ncbi:hypothetical protein CXK86_20470 [Paenibacillus sp. BGI2013]|nr:hypothetical protein CXK86_20470 [Paenibacillus sp. BGI2013]
MKEKLLASSLISLLLFSGTSSVIAHQRKCKSWSYVLDQLCKMGTGLNMENIIIMAVVLSQVRSIE